MMWRAAGWLLLAASGVAAAQTYPAKSIRVVVPFPSGGPSDIVGRVVSQKLSEAWGQPVIVDNRPGYQSAELVARAQPDGYTLLVATTNFFYAPLLQQSIGYEPVRDFMPVAELVRAPGMLVVSPTLPVNTVAELVALAKSKPGVYNYASAQTGGSGHLTTEQFKALAGIDLVRVSYKSTSLAFPDLMSGQVHVMFENLPAVMPHVKAGRLKALAVTSAQPTPLAPGLPTVAATVPGFEASSMITLLAPIKTPRTLVTRLNQETVRIVNQPDVKEKLFGSAAVQLNSTPEELAVWMKAEIAKMAKVIKNAGIRVE